MLSASGMDLGLYMVQERDSLPLCSNRTAFAISAIRRARCLSRGRLGIYKIRPNPEQTDAAQPPARAC